MTWLPQIAFALFFAWLLFSGTRRRKPCPDCGQPLSLFLSPFKKTRRQWLEGGFLCRHCGCESDISGERVPPGTSPSLRSVLVGIALVALASVPAVVMLVMLLRP